MKLQSLADQIIIKLVYLDSQA